MNFIAPKPASWRTAQRSSRGQKEISGNRRRETTTKMRIPRMFTARVARATHRRPPPNLTAVIWAAAVSVVRKIVRLEKMSSRCTPCGIAVKSVRAMFSANPTAVTCSTNRASVSRPAGRCRKWVTISGATANKTTPPTTPIAMKSVNAVPMMRPIARRS